MQPTALNRSPETSPSHSRFAQWPHRLLLLLIVMAAAILRFAYLARKPFWFDECFGVELARLDWRNFLHLLWWREANMSLYYVLLRVWLHVGQSEYFIRALSVVFAVATVPAIYWLARLLHDHRVALGAAGLLAINAFHIRYSQEARSYALFALLATLSSGFLVAWVKEPNPRNRSGYILASILAVYAHFYALLLIAAHIVTILWAGRPERASDQNEAERVSPLDLRRAWIAIGIAVLPLLIFVAKTGAGPIRWIQRPRAGDLLAFFEHLAGGSTWGLAVVFAASLIVAVAPLRKHLLGHNQAWESWRCQFLLIWLLFPVALTVLLSFARPVFLPRYMTFCLPALLVLVAAGIARLAYIWLLASALAIVMALSAQGISFIYSHDFDAERDASGAASYFILDHAQPRDAIIFHVANVRVPYEFFRSVRAGENTAGPNFARSFGPEIVYPRHAAGLDYRDFTGKPTAEFVRSVALQHSRLWLMLMNNGRLDNPDPTTRMLNEILPEHFTNMQRWELAHVEVRLYSRE